jgi:hypothetical protein
MSQVTTNKGVLIEVADLVLQADYIYNFVQLHQGSNKHFPSDWGLDRAFRNIVDRGMAEITRTEKTKVKVAQDKAAGTLLKELGMNPEEAKRFILHMQALEAAKQNGEAKATAKK